MKTFTTTTIATTFAAAFQAAGAGFAAVITSVSSPSSWRRWRSVGVGHHGVGVRQGLLGDRLATLAPAAAHACASRPNASRGMQRNYPLASRMSADA